MAPNSNSITPRARLIARAIALARTRIRGVDPGPEGLGGWADGLVAAP